MLQNILIANRGEIACRIIRTVQRMGLRAIAVYSDADATALHVESADEGYRLGPPPAPESYLSIDRVIQAARDGRADAIHPGYGFLSENPALADACAEAGLVFIGPSAQAIRVMGSKIEAKRLAGDAGVPVVPGYDGSSQSRGDLRAAGDEIGYPLLIKASAGGGGRGMRLVTDASGFDKALEGASREAKSAFGDGRVLLERYISRSRHVEVQVFGDSHGNVVHLFERDCSIQRRHQKVLEEAPAPGLDGAIRDAMSEAAVEVARSVAYVGAGTVEFIVDCDRVAADDGFYFLEMNTRLQVEHPVTEMVTGLDLVEWQIRVAAGETLPLAQSQLQCRGHAVEARLYAEDPRRKFLPSIGDIAHLRFPTETDTVRIDSGVRVGDIVSRHYDPMIAKLVVWGEDRDIALRRLAIALRRTEIVGVASNRDFLLGVTGHAAFRDGAFDTGFVEDHRRDLLVETPPPLVESVALLAVAEIDAMRRVRANRSSSEGDRYSPWNRLDNWRLFGQGRTVLRLRDGESDLTVRIMLADGYLMLGLPDRRVRVVGTVEEEGTVSANVDEHHVRGRVVSRGSERHILIGGDARRLIVEDADSTASAADAGANLLTAPLPATVAFVHARSGETVKQGDPLMVLEAMKMEHLIVAPGNGVIGQVHFAVGDQVEEGAELIAFESD